MIERDLFSTLNTKFYKGKAIVLLGPRQVGKTTLIHACLNGKEFLFLNGDDPVDRDLLENAGVGENITADIIGHEKPRITYGLYSGGSTLETMREAIEKIRYKLT